MNNPNLELLRQMARRLEPLLDQVVFLGGCVTGLLLTDPASPPVRPTTDVDVMAEIASRVDYYQLSEQLRTMGFREHMADGAPICRWMVDGMELDIMPTSPDILGFSNRWYPEAMQHAIPYQLDEALIIRVITAPYFLATKLEAFYGRGNGDYLFSHDLEDFITVIDGRPELLLEITSSPRALQDYLAKEIQQLMAKPVFLDAMPGYLPGDSASQRRLPALFKQLRNISSICSPIPTSAHRPVTRPGVD